MEPATAPPVFLRLTDFDSTLATSFLLNLLPFSFLTDGYEDEDDAFTVLPSAETAAEVELVVVGNALPNFLLNLSTVIVCGHGPWNMERNKEEDDKLKLK